MNEVFCAFFLSSLFSLSFLSFLSFHFLESVDLKSGYSFGYLQGWVVE